MTLDNLAALWLLAMDLTDNGLGYGEALTLVADSCEVTP